MRDGGSCAQRVGILDHIGTTSGGGAGREQHEARGRKHLAREIAPHRQIVRNVLAGSIVQPRQLHTRGEFTAVRIEPEPLHQPLQLGLQLDQRPARLDGSDYRAWFLAAKARQALHLDLERLAVDAKQHRGDFVGGNAVDIADEAQGDVIIFGIDPAGARKAAPQSGKRVADLGRDFQSSEQTRHRMTPDAWAWPWQGPCPVTAPGDESPIAIFYLTSVTLRSTWRLRISNLLGIAAFSTALPGDS